MLANIPTATQADSTLVPLLTKNIAELTSQVTLLTAKLLTAQSEKARLKISGYCSAKSGALADRTTTRDQNMYAKSGQIFNPNGYCSSKVFKVEETHTSATFRVPLDEQNKLETLMYT